MSDEPEQYKCFPGDPTDVFGDYMPEGLRSTALGELMFYVADQTHRSAWFLQLVDLLKHSVKAAKAKLAKALRVVVELALQQLDRDQLREEFLALEADLRRELGRELTPQEVGVWQSCLIAEDYQERQADSLSAAHTVDLRELVFKTDDELAEDFEEEILQSFYEERAKPAILYARAYQLYNDPDGEYQDSLSRMLDYRGGHDGEELYEDERYEQFLENEEGLLPEPWELDPARWIGSYAVEQLLSEIDDGGLEEFLKNNPRTAQAYKEQWALKKRDEVVDSVYLNIVEALELAPTLSALAELAEDSPDTTSWQALGAWVGQLALGLANKLKFYTSPSKPPASTLADTLAGIAACIDSAYLFYSRFSDLTVLALKSVSDAYQEEAENEVEEQVDEVEEEEARLDPSGEEQAVQQVEAHGEEEEQDEDLEGLTLVRAAEISKWAEDFLGRGYTPDDLRELWLPELLEEELGEDLLELLRSLLEESPGGFSACSFFLVDTASLVNLLLGTEANQLGEGVYLGDFDVRMWSANLDLVSMPSEGFNSSLLKELSSIIFANGVGGSQRVPEYFLEFLRTCVLPVFDFPQVQPTGRQYARSVLQFEDEFAEPPEDSEVEEARREELRKLDWICEAAWLADQIEDASAGGYVKYEGSTREWLELIASRLAESLELRGLARQLHTVCASASGDWRRRTWDSQDYMDKNLPERVENALCSIRMSVASFAGLLRSTAWQGRVKPYALTVLEYLGEMIHIYLISRGWLQSVKLLELWKQIAKDPDEVDKVVRGGDVDPQKFLELLNAHGVFFQECLGRPRPEEGYDW